MGQEEFYDINAAPPLFRRYLKEDGDCWIFTGFTTHLGYGHFRGHDLDEQLAHRFAYRIYVGDIPAGLELDHLCRNRACVNPAHLEPVTHGENVRRAARQRTHCRNGHEFSGENLRIVRESGRTYRRCVECIRAAGRRCYWRQKEAAV